MLFLYVLAERANHSTEICENLHSYTFISAEGSNESLFTFDEC